MKRDLNAYRTNRLTRQHLAHGECEAQWHPNCSSSSTFHAHHVHMRRHGGSDDVENLRWVCEWCHNRIHARPLEAQHRGLLTGIKDPTLPR